ncbi:MAG: hypothetical protein K2H40_04950, partial [Lachnospiraceae bacterium]|nr:hypothetical protein [Lachnospiraceae bacterium]
TIRELYLYPYCSKGENIFRGFVWMASWLVGIVLPHTAETALLQTAGQQALGGAYLIFAASLLLEFIPEGRTLPLAKIVYGIFCILLFTIATGALVMSFGETSQLGSLPQVFKFLILHLPHIGWIVFGIIFVSVMLAIIEVHKIVYDEDAERQREIEARQEMEREKFMEHLNGSLEGDNT